MDFLKDLLMDQLMNLLMDYSVALLIDLLMVIMTGLLKDRAGRIGRNMNVNNPHGEVGQNRIKEG